MRLYLRLLPDNATRDQCLQWQKKACAPYERRYRLELIDAPQLHLTLVELRDIDDTLRARVCNAFSHIESTTITSYAVRVDWFPSIDKPSVIAALIHLDNNLAALYHEVRNRLQQLDINPAQRPIRPHITLARAHQRSISPDGHLPYDCEANSCTFHALSLFDGNHTIKTTTQ